MTRLELALEGIVGELTRRKLGIALVGGLAVSARTEPRFTRDVDLAVSVDSDATAEALVRDLVAMGYRVLALVEHAHVSRLATVRLLAPREPEGGIVVDLLFGSSGIEREIAEDAEPLAVFDASTVPVARVGHLIAMKLLARDDRTRPQDGADLKALLAVAGEDELARARAAIARIEERGFARGRDLRAALADALASRGGA